MLKYINTTKEYNSESEISKGEKNDCVVRAFASACNVPYDEAHAFVKKTFNRKHKQGTIYTAITIEKLGEAMGHDIKVLGIKYEEAKTKKYFVGHRLFNGISKRRNVHRHYTTKSFIKDYPKGTFFILCRGHAFTIKDGIVFGNTADSKQMLTRVENVYQFIKQ